MIHTHNKKVERKRANKVWCGGGVFDASNKKKPREKCKVEAKLALTVVVDDLDRCPKKQVMEMLKATHLLLEHPKAPMVVFLAVDPQLIVSAIAKSLDGVSNTVSGCCSSVSFAIWGIPTSDLKLSLQWHVFPL